MVKRTSRGTSLIEAMIAMLILAAMGTAVITITLQVMNLNTSTRLKNQGTAYAEQFIEQVRSNFQIPTNGYSWLLGKSSSRPVAYSDGNLQNPLSPACTPADCTGAALPSTWSPLPNSIYAGCVVVNNVDASNRIKVQSLIAWLDRGFCKYTEVDTYFTNY